MDKHKVKKLTESIADLEHRLREATAVSYRKNRRLELGAFLKEFAQGQLTCVSALSCQKHLPSITLHDL